MSITNTDISTTYSAAIDYVTNIAYNKYAKKMYAIQYKDTDLDKRLLLWLNVMDNWDNRIGAINPIAECQMVQVMDHIRRAQAEPFAATAISVEKVAGNNNISFAVLDTSSIDMSFSDNKLSAVLKISSQSGNGAFITADGLYVSAVGSEGGSGSGSSSVIFLTGDNFEPASNTYLNASLAGRTVKLWHRGLGELLYNVADPDDPINEIAQLPEGGVTITIPGFDVHDGNNYFYLTITNYETA